jgi:hypothetical protein
MGGLVRRKVMDPGLRSPLVAGAIAAGRMLVGCDVHATAKAAGARRVGAGDA